MLGLAFIKRISGLNKKTKKVPHVFFPKKVYTKTPDAFLPTRSFSPLANFADFVNPLLIQNQPPWHQMLDILT